jgi:hypothetical protein
MQESALADTRFANNRQSLGDFQFQAQVTQDNDFFSSFAVRFIDVARRKEATHNG